METQSNGQLKSRDLIDLKLKELITLVETADLDKTERSRIQYKVDAALKLARSGEDKSDHLQQFFSGHKTDTRKSRQNNLARSLTSIVRVIISLLLVCLGFGMIIMPAPPYFEMFTLFYINANDGVTIMDVISLIVAFIGVSLLISSIVKFKH